MTSWIDCWRMLGVGSSPELMQLHAEIEARYSEPHRHYHTLQHLSECFEKVTALLPLAEHPPEVLLALWFHDAIYDTQRLDNEERSAIWARDQAIELGVDAAAAQRIYDLVMATRHAAEPVGIDAQVLVDADLAVLGASVARFDEYEVQVRQEYAWVPEPVFRRKRAEVLKGFLARPQIYSTSVFRQRYEEQARSNLQRSIAKLQ